MDRERRVSASLAALVASSSARARPALAGSAIALILILCLTIIGSGIALTDGRPCRWEAEQMD